MADYASDGAKGFLLEAAGRTVSRAQLTAAILEEVDALFEALDIFSQQKDAIHFSEYCAQIASLTEAIAEAQSLGWWNIL